MVAAHQDGEDRSAVRTASFMSFPPCEKEDGETIPAPPGSSFGAVG
jgi:hypothetical protein